MNLTALHPPGVAFFRGASKEEWRFPFSIYFSFFFLLQFLLIPFFFLSLSKHYIKMFASFPFGHSKTFFDSTMWFYLLSCTFAIFSTSVYTIPSSKRFNFCFPYSTKICHCISNPSNNSNPFVFFSLPNQNCKLNINF